MLLRDQRPVIKKLEQDVRSRELPNFRYFATNRRSAGRGKPLPGRYNAGGDYRIKARCQSVSQRLPRSRWKAFGKGGAIRPIPLGPARGRLRFDFAEHTRLFVRRKRSRQHPSPRRAATIQKSTIYDSVVGTWTGRRGRRFRDRWERRFPAVFNHPVIQMVLKAPFAGRTAFHASRTQYRTLRRR